MIFILQLVLILIKDIHTTNKKSNCQIVWKNNLNKISKC